MIRYLKTFSLYTLVGVINAGISFLLLPILTRSLEPGDYGVISLVNVYVSVLMPIVGLSTAGLISVEYYNKGLSRPEFKSLFSSVRLIPVIGILVFLLIFLAGQSFLPKLMELPIQAYWAVIPLTLFSLIASNFSTFLVASKKAGVFTGTTFLKILFEIALTLLFVVVLNYHWQGRILSALLAAVLITGVSVYYYKKWDFLAWDIRKVYVMQAIVFGAPLILHQIGKFVINQSDRLFLAKMVSVEEMGIYSVGYQVGSIILILVTAFSNFFSPFLYERLAKNTDKAKQEIVKVSYVFLAGVLLALLVLQLVVPLLFDWFIDQRYKSGIRYVFWVGLGYFFWGIYTIFSGYIFFSKKTKILAWLALVNVFLNILFNYFFIQKFGPLGAAYATCLSYFIVAVAVVIIVSGIYRMPWFTTPLFKKSVR
ncbi:MAG: oligosaccharide flippase family protein [Chitinophagaceae bacterium]|nr:oligosaccharide flippase family protein [Chitinophagaceae bacterium]